MGLTPLCVRLARLGCLGLVLAALAGCGLAGGMYGDIKDLREAMQSKDDPDIQPQMVINDFLDPSLTPLPGRDIQPGQFLDTNGTVLDAAEAGRLASRFDYVLVGEGHTVSCDHLVQASLLRALAGAGKHPVVGLEMVATDRRGALHGFNIGRYGPETLDRALDWENTWGHAYSLYLPVFEAIRELGLSAEALNMPREAIRAVSDGGLSSLTPQQSAHLPVLIIPAIRAQREYLEEEFQRHQGMRSENATQDDAQALERFLLVQSLWDTKMAEEAIHARRRHGGPVAVLAGAGHVEYGWGIGMRLVTLDPGARVFTILPWRGGPVDRAAANLFFYCPMSHTSRLGFSLEMVEEADGQGALVTAVETGSRAEAAGLARGDVILRAQGEPVAGMFDLHKAAIKARKAGQDLVLTVLRNDAELDVSIPLSGGGADDAGTP